MLNKWIQRNNFWKQGRSSNGMYEYKGKWLNITFSSKKRSRCNHRKHNVSCR